jgi:hypothetical protein
MVFCQGFRRFHFHHAPGPGNKKPGQPAVNRPLDRIDQIACADLRIPRSRINIDISPLLFYDSIQNISKFQLKWHHQKNKPFHSINKRGSMMNAKCAYAVLIKRGKPRFAGGLPLFITENMKTG